MRPGLKPRDMARLGRTLVAFEGGRLNQVFDPAEPADLGHAVPAFMVQAAEDIPAMTGTTPGSGTASVYLLSGTELVDAGYDETVYNWGGSDLAEGDFALAVREPTSGALMVGQASAGPTINMIACTLNVPTASGQKCPLFVGFGDFASSWDNGRYYPLPLNANGASVTPNGSVESSPFVNIPSPGIYRVSCIVRIGTSGGGMFRRARLVANIGNPANQGTHTHSFDFAVESSAAVQILSGEMFLRVPQLLAPNAHVPGQWLTSNPFLVAASNPVQVCLILDYDGPTVLPTFGAGSYLYVQRIMDYA